MVSREDNCISVGDLIEALKLFDPDLPVMMFNPDDGSYYEPSCNACPADRIFNPPTKIMVEIR